MPGYYIYTLGDDGHVQGRLDVVCDDDEQAERRAEQLETDMPWSYVRKRARSPNLSPTSA